MDIPPLLTTYLNEGTDFFNKFKSINAKEQPSKVLKEVYKNVSNAQTLTYIISELIDNIDQHSKSTKAEIYYKKEKEKVTIIVTDNGIGMGQNLHEEDSFAL